MFTSYPRYPKNSLKPALESYPICLLFCKGWDCFGNPIPWSRMKENMRSGQKDICMLSVKDVYRRSSHITLHLHITGQCASMWPKLRKAASNMGLFKNILKKFLYGFFLIYKWKTLLKKKRQWVEALFLSNWACLALEPCPSLSPSLLSCPWVAPAYPPRQLSASPCRSGEIRTADLVSRSGMAAPACLGWTPDETRYTTLHAEKQPPSGSGPTSGFNW